jgi:hypothetical protein
MRVALKIDVDGMFTIKIPSSERSARMTTGDSSPKGSGPKSKADYLIESM